MSQFKTINRIFAMGVAIVTKNLTDTGKGSSSWTKTDRDMGFKRTKTTIRTTQRTGAHFQTRTRKGNEQKNYKDKDLKIGKKYDLTRTWERTWAKKGQLKGGGTDDRDKGKKKARKRKRTIKRRRTQTRKMTSDGQERRR